MWLPCVVQVLAVSRLSQTVTTVTRPSRQRLHRLNPLCVWNRFQMWLFCVVQVRAVSQLSQTVTTVSRLSGCFTTVTATPASDKPFMCLDQVSVLDVTCLCRAGSGCFTTVTATPARDAATPRPSWHPWWRPSWTTSGGPSAPSTECSRLSSEARSPSLLCSVSVVPLQNRARARPVEPLCVAAIN